MMPLRQHPANQIGNPPIAEEEKPLHTIALDFDKSIQLDEEEQQQRAIDSDERGERVRRTEQQVKREEQHRLAAKVRVHARNSPPGRKIAPAPGKLPSSVLVSKLHYTAVRGSSYGNSKQN